jgi:hypothetical protein
MKKSDTIPVGRNDIYMETKNTIQCDNQTRPELHQ